MLFESPFYVDFPLLIAAFTGPAAIVAIWLLIVFNRRGAFHDVVVGLFHRFLLRSNSRVLIETPRRTVRLYFLIMAVLFGGMSLYCVSVATGLIKNRVRNTTISPDELDRLDKLFEQLKQQRPAG